MKDSPVINDATLEDARQAGLDRVARLLSNGTDAPGTVLTQASAEFLDCFAAADVVISKGQANFETLNAADREIYFLTQIKCEFIARRYGYRLGDWLVTTRSAMLRARRSDRNPTKLNPHVPLHPVEKFHRVFLSPPSSPTDEFPHVRRCYDPLQSPPHQLRPLEGG